MKQSLHSSGVESTDISWEEDRRYRFDLKKLNQSFHDSVPSLKFLEWSISKVEKGFCETILPINVPSSNQYITHQAALCLLSADYTGGIALATLFNKIPIIGFHATDSDYGIYMWGGKASIKWYAPSCKDLVCRARIDENKKQYLFKRVLAGKKIVTTVDIFMYNDDKLIAKSEFTYWVQDTNSLRRDAFDINKIDILYDHKTKTTAKLVAGLRALESEKLQEKRRFVDDNAYEFAQKHGITLARRFNLITPQLQDMVSIRTWHLDKTLRDYCIRYNNKINIVNIGSGYDTRALRLDLSNTNIFDLDLPIMLRDRKLFFENKKVITNHVAIDLRSHDIAEILRDNKNFDLKKPTFFIWEGGSMYFSQEVDKIIGSISSLMNSDSMLWMDYVTQDSVRGLTNIMDVARFIENMKKMGEPFINGFNNIGEYANRFGLKVDSNLKSIEYSESKDLIYDHYRICTLVK